MKVYISKDEGDTPEESKRPYFELHMCRTQGQLLKRVNIDLPHELWQLVKLAGKETQLSDALQSAFWLGMEYSEDLQLASQQLPENPMVLSVELDPEDGKRDIAQSIKKVFGMMDPRFRRDLETGVKVTPRQKVEARRLDDGYNGNLGAVFESFSPSHLDKVCLTPVHVIQFCEKNHDWIKGRMNVFFLVEMGNDYRIVYVGRNRHKNYPKDKRYLEVEYHDYLFYGKNRWFVVPV